jgi:hypothetical protein
MRSERATRASGQANGKPTHNTGFRVTARQRFELEAAAPYLGTHSIQETLAIALNEFLDRMRETEGFGATLLTAEAHQQRRAGIERVDPRDEGI